MLQLQRNSAYTWARLHSIAWKEANLFRRQDFALKQERDNRVTVHLADSVSIIQEQLAGNTQRWKFTALVNYLLR